MSRSLRSSIQLAQRLGAQEFIAIANRAELQAELERTVKRTGFQRTAALLQDNVGSEFGAYQAGLEQARSTDPDWVGFANDTVSLHALFSRVNRKHLCAALANERREPGGRVAGVVDSIPEPLGELNVVRFARKARSILRKRNASLHCSRKGKPGPYIKTYSVRNRGLERLEAAFFKPLA